MNRNIAKKGPKIRKGIRRLEDQKVKYICLKLA